MKTLEAQQGSQLVFRNRKNAVIRTFPLPVLSDDFPVAQRKLKTGFGEIGLTIKRSQGEGNLLVEATVRCSETSDISVRKSHKAASRCNSKASIALANARGKGKLQHRQTRHQRRGTSPQPSYRRSFSSSWV